MLEQDLLSPKGGKEKKKKVNLITQHVTCKNYNNEIQFLTHVVIWDIVLYYCYRPTATFFFYLGLEQTMEKKITTLSTEVTEFCHPVRIKKSCSYVIAKLSFSDLVKATASYGSSKFPLK